MMLSKEHKNFLGAEIKEKKLIESLNNNLHKTLKKIVRSDRYTNQKTNSSSK